MGDRHLKFHETRDNLRFDGEFRPLWKLVLYEKSDLFRVDGHTFWNWSQVRRLTQRSAPLVVSSHG